MWTLLWFLIVAMILTQVADVYMTVRGFEKGDIETGIINGPVVKKWGQGALAPAAFVEGLLSLGAVAAASTAGVEYGLVFAGVFAAVELVNDIRSFLLLKKQKAI